MLQKKFRITEEQVKKVLHKGKPFFSFWIVLNVLENKLDHHRFAIVIGGKSTTTGVERNFFRRRFYDLAFPYIQRWTKNVFFDLVFVVKKSTLLSKNEQSSLEKFYKEIDFLFTKVFPYER